MRDAKARGIMAGFRQAGRDAKPGQIAATVDDIARESRCRIVAPGLETAGVAGPGHGFCKSVYKNYMARVRSPFQSRGPRQASPRLPRPSAADLTIKCHAMSKLAHRSACLARCRTPPSQAQGRAVSTSAIGYQFGPRSMPLVVIAPALLSTSPTAPNAKA